MIVNQLAHFFTQQNLTLSAVESCTGGLVSKTCTDVAGSSSWFQGGLVTYSNAMKATLGVPVQLIEQQGAVSQAVVEQMAVQGRLFCQSDWSIAVTGIAGPSGGSAEKPVGTVWMAWANEHSVESQVKVFEGDRQAIRQGVSDYVLQQMLNNVKK